MLLAFVPLFFAVATYTSYALQQVRSAHARARASASSCVRATRITDCWGFPPPSRLIHAIQ